MSPKSKTKRKAGDACDAARSAKKGAVEEKKATAPVAAGGAAPAPLAESVMGALIASTDWTGSVACAGCRHRWASNGGGGALKWCYPKCAEAEKRLMRQGVCGCLEHVELCLKGDRDVKCDGTLVPGSNVMWSCISVRDLHPLTFVFECNIFVCCVLALRWVRNARGVVCIP